MSTSLRRLRRMTAPELDGEIERLSRAGSSPEGLAARALALGVRFQRDQRPQTLVEALTDFDALPRASAQRPEVARQLVLRQLEAAMLDQPADTARMRRMLDEAGDDPDRPGTLAVLSAMVHAAEALVDDSGIDRTPALDELRRLLVSMPAEHHLRPVVEALRNAVEFRQGVAYGDMDAPRRFAQRTRATAGHLGANDVAQQLARLATVAAEGQAAMQRGDLVGARNVIMQMTTMIEQIPPDHPGASPMRTMVEQLSGLLAMLGGPVPGPVRGPATGPVGGAVIDPLEQAARMPGLTAGERSFRLVAWGTSQVMLAEASRDVALLRRGTQHLREAVDAAPGDDPRRIYALASFGRALTTLAQLERDRTMLVEARFRLEEAVTAAGDPRHPLWALAAIALAAVLRLTGDRAAGRTWGLRALPGHAWDVLLQSGVAHATSAADDAIEEAVQVARWCMEDQDAESAALALEAGRGLLLHAATTSRDVSDRLVALGRHDLADQWRRQGGGGDGIAAPDLRYRVLAALTRTDGAQPPGDGPAGPGGVLDPPATAEVRYALRQVDADALVYLVPADDEGGGMAVIVPRDEAASVLALPHLRVDRGGPVTSHRLALAARDAAGDDDRAAATRRWRAALASVCDWAWDAAIGPLLEARAGAAQRHIVLIPLGDLATVPWHAARSRTLGYAVEHATFSYAPSARLLCARASQPAVPADGGGLVVGDPTGDLRSARAEAAAIRETFLPGARLLGRHDLAEVDGPADRAALVSWLRDRDGSRAVLHLACHGVVAAGDAARSHLALAGFDRDRHRVDPGTVLSAADIVEMQVAPIGLVTLAACTTGVATGSYDEAFSIASAFLVAGARTVYGSLWTVPDTATSLLMYMTYHFLHADGRSPAEALARAQRWMLAPRREVPAGMPRPLAAWVASIDAGDVAGWAGFTHMGA